MKYFYLSLVGMAFLMQSFAFASPELLEAAQSGNITEVRRLLDAGADVNYADQDGVTALHTAVRHYYNGGLVQLLLDRGANVKAASRNGYTALHIVVGKDYSPYGFRPGVSHIVYLLLHGGANVNAADANGRTPLHEAAEVYSSEDYEVVKFLIQQGANVNAISNDGSTPLHVAVSRANIREVQFLLNRGANRNAAANDGSTPLHVAVSRGEITIVQRLLDRGVIINVAATNGRTPRDLAVSLGSRGVAIVQLLDRVTAERAAAAAARIAQANRVSLDPQVVSAQADLDAAAALEAYRIAAEASIAAQAAAAQEPTNTQRAQARDATARAALEAQTRSAEASLYAQTRRDLAQRATYEEAIKQLKADHQVEIKGLKTVVGLLCFPGETAISVKNPDSSEGYHSQPISSIRVGDSVVSCNLEVEGGACEFAQVKGVMKNTTDHLIQLSFDGRILRATDNHPFYVVNKKEWVEAQYLRVGDQLRDISGKTLTVKEVQGESGTFTVHNLEVETYNNYFANKVLVHNCNQLGVQVPPDI